MASLAEQLGGMIERWSAEVMREASTEMTFKAKTECPVAPIGGGEMISTIAADQVDPLRYRLSVEDRGYTDEGPEPHPIEGNPLLVFDWPEAPPSYGGALFPAVFRHVDWKPGAGVAANKGWWSDRTITDDNFEDCLRIAAEVVNLGD